MRPSRWDLILEQKPRPILDHLLDEVAVLFAADVSAWPPNIEHFDDVTGAALRALVAETPLRPDVRLYQQAFHLTRLDVGRDLEGYDDYVRNQRWLDAGLSAGDKPLMLFLSRFMVEQLLALGEATHGRVDRPAMLDVLAKTERHFLKELQQ
ncbi:MAG: hypothetical protein JNG84_14960 [Archangium sp.]|nr:hypothetical protein [Archangium sp.]